MIEERQTKGGGGLRVCRFRQEDDGKTQGIRSKRAGPFPWGVWWCARVCIEAKGRNGERERDTPTDRKLQTETALYLLALVAGRSSTPLRFREGQ